MISELRPLVSSAPAMSELMSVAVKVYLDSKTDDEIEADLAAQKERNKKDCMNLDQETLRLEWNVGDYMDKFLLHIMQPHAANLLLQAAYDNFATAWQKAGIKDRKFKTLTELMHTALGHEELKLAIDVNPTEPMNFEDRPLTGTSYE